MKLQDKLDAFTTNLIESRAIPDEIVKELMDVIGLQISSGQMNHALRAGQVAPSFVLPDADDNTFSSAERLRSGPLVVTFYRGVWCPYCNLELEALQAIRREIEDPGTTLVAVSMQNAANSRKSARQNQLNFAILVDKGGVLAAKFGLRYDLSARLLEVYKSLGNDLTLINDEDSGPLPMPARFVIGQDGIFAYAEVNSDYTKRPEPNDLLPVFDQLIRQRAA